MTTVVMAIYENGVFKPETPVDLKDRTKVHLVIETTTAAADDDDPTGGKTAMALKGCIKNAVDADFTHSFVARPGPLPHRS